MTTRIHCSATLARVVTAGVLLTAAGTLSALPESAAAAPGTAHLLSCTGRQLTRPQGTVVLACGDGNIVIRDTQWSSWTKRSARGTTRLDINLCVPTCVQSKMREFAGSTVRLLDTKQTSSGPVFSRASITFTDAGKRTTVSAYPRT